MTIRKRFIHLLIGPVLAVVIGAFAGPVIARLYDPAVYGIYSVLAAVVAIGVVASTLRFEQLIPSSADPVATFWVAIISASITSLLVFPLSLFFLTLNETLYITLGIFLLALFNCSYYLLITSESNKKASLGRVTQAGGILTGQSVLGLTGFGTLSGLMWGEIFGRLCSVLVIFRPVDMPDCKNIKRAFWAQWRAVRWLLPASLVGVLALQLLPLGMSASVGASAAGVFILVYRMVVVPNALISKVASDTLLVEMGRMGTHSENRKELVERGVQKLLFAALGLYGSLALHSSWIFPVILGENWSLSGEIAPWLCVMVGFWSLASPMASVFVALEKTYWSFVLSVLDVASRAAALAVGFFFMDPILVAQALALGGMLVYGLSLSCSMHLCGTNLVLAVAPIKWAFFALVALHSLACWLYLINFLWASVAVSSAMSFLAFKKVLYG